MLNTNMYILNLNCEVQEIKTFFFEFLNFLPVFAWLKNQVKSDSLLVPLITT